MPERISSVQNPRIKNLVRLRDSSHRRRQQLFLVEGQRELERAFACRWPIESVYFCEELFRDETSFDCIHALEEADIELVQLSEDAFAKASARQGPDGLLAVARQRLHRLEELPLSPNPLLVILEGIEKPGNLGAIFRTANAAGADALILANPVTDPFNPNAVRASQGAIFELPVAVTDNAGAFVFLEDHGIKPILTAPAAERTFWEADLRGPVALVMGAEDTGLSAEWTQHCAAWRLPMRGITDSLNVSSMTAVALFEAVRQRQTTPD